MKSILSITVLFIVLAAGISLAEDDRSPETGYDKYKVIYQQNMFSKNRRPPRDERKTRQVEQTKTTAVYILRGIASEEGKKHKVAIIEEEIAARSQTAEMGTTILNGRITEIHPDYIVFEENGETRKIQVGEQIATSRETFKVEVEDTGEPGDTETKPPEEKTDDSSSSEEDDVLKKLMERRKREIGN